MVGNEICDAALASLLHVEGALVVIPLTHLRILSDGEPHPSVSCYLIFQLSSQVNKDLEAKCVRRLGLGAQLP
jgi:hypothetical protein